MNEHFFMEIYLAIRHTDEMRSILEVVLNSYLIFLVTVPGKHPAVPVSQR